MKAILFGAAAVAGIAVVSGWQGAEPGDLPGAAPVQPMLTPIGNAPPAPHRVNYRRLDAQLQRLIRIKGMTGLGVALVEGNQVTFVKGYGTTEPDGRGEPVTPRTVFRWASLSKTVAATALAKLAEQGKLSLSDPVAKFRTTLRLPGGGEGLATVEDLLSHRLGLPRNAYDDKLEAGEDPRLIRQALAMVAKLCSPGACFSYQNIAFDAGSEIASRVTGRSYETMVQQQLFGPLGMTNASLSRGGLVGAASFAQPSRGTRTLPVLEPYYRVPAAGGVNSSIFDLGLWLKAQMGGNPSVLSPALLETIHRGRIRVPSRGGEFARAMTDGHYALGWRNHRLGDHVLVGHRGAVSGYRSLILFDPQQKVGIAMLWNSESIRPVGVPLEVFGALYGLPPVDYLKLDEQDMK